MYPLELSCDMTAGTPIRNLDPKAPVFRPTRDAAVAAKVRIQDQADDEELSQELIMTFITYRLLIGHDLVTFPCSFLSEMNRGGVCVRL